MAVIGIDLGGTKIATARFSEDGMPYDSEKISLDGRTGPAVGRLIVGQIERLMKSGGTEITSVGVSVPGISWSDNGTVWAPNIAGWEKYPLRDEIQSSLPDRIPVAIESDRSCYILGETWRGAAKGARDAIFIAVGTGIGAGIMVDGVILHGTCDIAGSIGWMALQRPYRGEYTSCGCFEYYASGDGIARTARRMLDENPGYTGILGKSDPARITSHDVFNAYDNGDTLAADVLGNAIELWGMAVANLVSIFNPEIIVFGGGVFGPAVIFLDRILAEAKKWAQPISITRVLLKPSELGDKAGLVGAGKLAMTAQETRK